MELHEKSREELWESAKRLGLKPAKNIKTDVLADEVELATMKRRIRIEEEEREKLRVEYRIRQEIAEIRAAANLAKIPITIPDNPTAVDTARLRQEIGIKKKIAKPSPETKAIEASKKVYARFHNQESRDEDVHFNQGGKYDFDLWPERIHVLPEWLIGSLRRTAVIPIYGKIPDPHDDKKFISGRTGSLTRFIFEVLGDAPNDADFGVVLDKKILSKFEQPQVI